MMDWVMNEEEIGYMRLFIKRALRFHKSILKI
jgi:hypothetical protein